MLSKNIKIGDRLEITLKRDKTLGKSYISQVENILDELQVVVHMPISYGQIVRLPFSDNYSFLFFTEKTLLRFEGTIVSFFVEDGFNLMTIKLITDGERIQRREFFRFTCLLPLKFSVLYEDNPTNQETKEGIIKDVGGGGIRFVANESIEEGLKIKCFILLNDDYLIIIGKILHKQNFPKSVYKYQYRAVFIGILPNEQERIVNFIFSEQRKNFKNQVCRSCSHE